MEGSQSRRRLAELFWPRGSNIMGNLTTVLSRLRKLDDQLIEADKYKVSTTLTCDVLVLKNAFDSNDYQGVIDNYEGRFLDGFYLKDIGAELEDWVYQTRESIGNIARQAYLNLAEQQASEGRMFEAAMAAEQAYLISGASEPSETDLKRIYLLLIEASHPLSNEVKREAETFGVLLSQNIDEAMGVLGDVTVTVERPDF